MRDVNPLEVGPKVYEIGNESAILQPPANSMSLLTSSHVEAASTLAVIASSNEPLLFLGSGDSAFYAAPLRDAQWLIVGCVKGPRGQRVNRNALSPQRNLESGATALRVSAEVVR